MVHAIPYIKFNRGLKLKKLIIVIFILIPIPVLSYAEDYRVDGVYDLSIPNDWQVASKPQAIRLLEDAKKVVKEANLKLDVKSQDIVTPFVAYKEKNKELFLARVIIGPPEVVAEDEFDNFTDLDIKNIGEYLSSRQNELLEASGYRLESSRYGKESFKGTSAFHMVRTYYDPKGHKVSRGQYIVYRTTATLIISMEHTVIKGEPDYRLIESQISLFNILAE